LPTLSDTHSSGGSSSYWNWKLRYGRFLRHVGTPRSVMSVRHSTRRLAKPAEDGRGVELPSVGIPKNAASLLVLPGRPGTTSATESTSVTKFTRLYNPRAGDDSRRPWQRATSVFVASCAHARMIANHERTSRPGQAYIDPQCWTAVRRRRPGDCILPARDVGRGSLRLPL
jgi:hypothetical protein